MKLADTVVVGAGFAGAVVVRQLRRAGLEVVWLEGRDRPGGRTWTREWHGWPAELGGQWIHWCQPFVWAEVTASGLALVERQSFEQASWWADGKREEASAADFHQAYAGVLGQLAEPARRLFPLPYEPMRQRAAVAAEDQKSFADALSALAPDRHGEAICKALASVMFNAPGASGAYTQYLRRVAAASGSAELLAESVTTYKLAAGSGALLDVIAAAAGSGPSLRSVVERIDVSGRVATVALAGGEEVPTKRVVVTAPIHALGRIEFRPALSDGKRQLIREGQVSRGAMLWVRTDYDGESLLAFGNGQGPVANLRSDGELSGARLFNVFVNDARALDLDSVDQVQSAIDQVSPGIRVLEVLSHDWIGDPFSGETWPMLRPGQLTRLFEPWQEPAGPIYFAGADYASGWFGFIDGAIESGLRVANSLLQGLTERTED